MGSARSMVCVDIALKRDRRTAGRLRAPGRYAAVCPLRINAVLLLNTDGCDTLATLRCRRANRRPIERCRTVAAGKSGGGGSDGESCKQSGGKLAGLHDVTPIKISLGRAKSRNQSHPPSPPSPKH